MSKNSALIDIFNAALAAVDPYQAVLNLVRVEKNCLHIADTIYDLELFRRIIVIGAGKATARMAMAMESLLGDRLSGGLIIVKEGHAAPLKIIQQIAAAHPVPNQAGVDGTQKIIKMVQGEDAQTLIICLISGGASALLIAPADKLTLEDKQGVTSLLLKSGASIDELNAVRKHLSAVKGGKLAQLASPAHMLTLILSDVIGDRLDVIASGPTAADDSTFADAWAVIDKYQLATKISPRVLDHLKRGLTGGVSETVKKNDPCLFKVHNVIVGGISLALNAAREKALQLGINAEIIQADLQGEARVAAHFLAQAARLKLSNMKPREQCCLLSGGETTVTVRGSGMGGRNQELALAFALEMAGVEGVSLLSAGTDGSDGPNDAAGAIINGSTATTALQGGLDPAHYLENNDSYHFFQSFDAYSGEHTHLITGPTGTNVMDIQIMLLDK